MKFWFYGIGLALLPVIYVVLMVFTGQPIEWWVLGLMAVIVLPILVFGKKITSVEQEFNAMSDQEKLKVVTKTAAKIAKNRMDI